MIVFSILDDVFKTEPLFLINCSARRAQSYLKQSFGITVSPPIQERSAATVLSFDKPPWRVVWIEKMDSGYEAWGCAVHELFHLVVRVMRDKGIPIVANFENGECGDEAAAYLMDFYFRQFSEKLNKASKVKK